MTKRNIVINADADNNLFLYEVGTDNFEPINKKAFGDLSMRAANLDPSQTRKALGLDKSSAIFDKIEDVYNFWCELSQERQGSTQVRGAYRHEITQQNGQTVEIRVAQNIYELPDKAVQELTIEHATQLHALDAEIVYRLELTYESITNHERAFLAEKRVVSGCGNELVNARLTSRDSSGVITPLDIEDAALMKQLQGALEIAFQTA